MNEDPLRLYNFIQSVSSVQKCVLHEGSSSHVWYVGWGFDVILPRCIVVHGHKEKTTTTNMWGWSNKSFLAWELQWSRERGVKVPPHQVHGCLSDHESIIWYKKHSTIVPNIALSTYHQIVADVACVWLCDYAQGSDTSPVIGVVLQWVFTRWAAARWYKPPVSWPRFRNEHHSRSNVTLHWSEDWFWKCDLEEVRAHVQPFTPLLHFWISIDLQHVY